MFYVYILYSSAKSRFYIGQTNDLNDRLMRHNSGYEKFTKYGVPWKVIYKTKVETRSQAVKLEQKIKKRGARRYLTDIGFAFES